MSEVQRGPSVGGRRTRIYIKQLHGVVEQAVNWQDREMVYTTHCCLSAKSPIPTIISLCYTILYDTKLNHIFTMLCYAMLCYAMLCYTIIYYTILYYTILYYTILYYTSPNPEQRPSGRCARGGGPDRRPPSTQPTPQQTRDHNSDLRARCFGQRRMRYHRWLHRRNRGTYPLPGYVGASARAAPLRKYSYFFGGTSL